jgi:intraflagellar transport protein 140
MIDEAKKLFEECGRNDLLIKLNISLGDYENAINIANKKERISLKNTNYIIAQNYEKLGNTEKAIEYYKVSGTHIREIPRMLIKNGKENELEQFINNEKDSKLYVWWASYCERNGKLEEAMEYFTKAKDHTNICRIYLANNKIDEAKQICDETKDQGACYLLGRLLEETGEIKEAINYYALSLRINQAFRLAKSNNLDGEIYNLALQAQPSTKSTIADYFEKKGDYVKAAKLFQQSGNIKKALNICLLSNQYDLTREIAENVEYKNDPETLKSLAEHFQEQGHIEKALGIYIRLKDYDIALKICEENKLKISVETADAIFDDLDIKTQNEKKRLLLKKLAKQLTIQGDFELAHQKFVQMGELKKAMKSLIKTGDKDKIINFANTSRTNFNYILAANFLQTLEWVENPEIVKYIVGFYKKAKAFNNLSNFYLTCANVEINDYRNYEKAIEAMGESIKVLESAKDIEELEKKERVDNLKERMKLTKLFVHITTIKGQSENAMKLCNDLLEIVKLL